MKQCVNMPLSHSTKADYGYGDLLSGRHVEDLYLLIVKLLIRIFFLAQLFLDYDGRSRFNTLEYLKPSRSTTLSIRFPTSRIGL